MPLALVIDDDPAIRSILRLKMESRGWLVIEAADAYRGLQVFRLCKPRLVTLDVMMPINDGVGAAELAKTITNETSGTILVIVSGFAATPEVSDFFHKLQIPVLSKASIDHPRLDRLFTYLDTVLKLDTTSVTTEASEDTNNGHNK